MTFLADFRTDFPEFASVAKYPDATASFWIAVAQRLVLASVWQDMTTNAQELFVAHQLVLSYRNQHSNIPGGIAGVLTSKSVDKAAAGYDVSKISLDNGGHWNQTNYGVQFLQLARMFGAQGAVQL